MQLKSLRIFCDVVRAGSFSRGAAENGLSQSAASQVINQLEERLGVKLIDRSKRPWDLTAEGDYFYRGCRKIVRQYRDLEDGVRSFHDEVVGHIRVASIYSVGLSHMNRHVQDFLRRNPKADIQLQYEHPDRVYQLIERDAVDLGLVSFPKDSRQITAQPWRDEAMVFACSPEHPLASRKLIQVADLNGLPFVHFGGDLKIRRELDRFLTKHDVTVQTVMQFDNTEIIKRAIETNTGVGLLPEPTVAREVQLGSLVAVPLLNNDGQPAMCRPLGIVYRKGRNLPSAAVRFIRELQESEPALDLLHLPNSMMAKPNGANTANGANGTQRVNGSHGINDSTKVERPVGDYDI